MEYKLLKNIAKITMGQSPESSSYNQDQDGLESYQLLWWEAFDIPKPEKME